MKFKVMEFKIVCKNCGWIGFKSELDFRADATNYEVDICPFCGSDYCHDGFDDLGTEIVEIEYN